MASDTVGDYKLEFAITLGTGNFGHVVKGYHKDTKVPVAVKRIKINRHNKTQETYLDREINALQEIPYHTNIVQMHHHETKDGYLNIMMDFCDQGTLEEFMEEHDIEFPQLIVFVCEIVDGVHFMHNLEKPVIHRDLSTGNIFIKTINGNLVIKIGDFGTAKTISKDKVTGTLIGTLCYMPPEVCKGYNAGGTVQLGKPVDVFSLGIIIHEMLENKADDAVKYLCG